MNIELQNNLKKVKCSIKWKNFDKWQKEKEVNNLLDVLNIYDIKICKKNKYPHIILRRGFIKIEYASCFSFLEYDIIKVLSMFFQYLGDKAKIITNFKTIKINH